MNDWHVVRILVPLMLPIVLLGLLALLGAVRIRTWEAIIAPIKDGQLAWAGMGFCVNGLYELRHDSRGLLHGSYGDALYWLLILILLLLAVVAAVSARPHGVRVRSKSKQSIFKLWPLTVSLVLCLLAAVLYSIVHSNV